MSIINIEENYKVVPVLLCGGSGTRLWPLSRESFPKQYLKYTSKSNNSFLQETQLRISKIKNIQAPILICNEDHRFIVAEQMREIEIMPNSIMLEPFGRNTAPAIAIASYKALESDDDPILLTLPADHSIEDVEKFIEIIEKAMIYAKQGFIVTFGIPPNSPETGFGYIESELSLNSEYNNAVDIKRFIEKPDKDTARKFLLDKKYSWNSGIFLLKAKVALQEINKFSPEIITLCNESFIKSDRDLDFQRLKGDFFKDCPNISFDLAVMEKTSLGKVLLLDVGWNDSGSWDNFWKIAKKDENGNAIDGKVLIENVKNSYLHSESRLIVGLDIENLVVVETYDSILVSKRSSSQNLKNIVSKLSMLNYEEAKKHRKIFRPWGNYLSIADGATWQVKIINVKPGASLSLQKHNFRSEHWVVVSGKALIEVENQREFLSENESTYIPVGFKHRLSNPGKDDLVLIEVQSGTYLGEDDIIRLEDNYGREKFNE